MPPSKSKKKKRNGNSTKVVTAHSLMKKGGWPVLLRSSGCKHGCPDLPPHDHPVYTFLNLFEDDIKKSSNEYRNPWQVPQFMMDSFISHKEVWHVAESNEYIYLALDILRAVGTHLIIKGVEAPETSIVFAIMLLEMRVEQISSYKQWSMDELQNSYSVQIENAGKVNRKIVEGESRELLRFLSKRIPCSCLDEKYKEAKKCQSKVGLCQGCNTKVDRKTLMVCNRCRMYQFCSQACFEASSPHKEVCKKLHASRKEYKNYWKEDS